jgi:hypothetical protein
MDVEEASTVVEGDYYAILGRFMFESLSLYI